MKENLCRICLNKVLDGHSITEMILEKPIWSCISELASVQVEPGDSYPQTVCTTCYRDLYTSIELQARILRTVEKLYSDILEIKLEPDVEVKPELIETDCQEKSLKPETHKKRIKYRKRLTQEQKQLSGLQCCMCGISFEVEPELKKHCDLKHPNGTPTNASKWMPRQLHKCPYCFRKFRLKTSLKAHFKDVSFAEPEYDKEKYNQMLVRARRYRLHEKKICPTCGLELCDNKSLILHEDAKHSLVKDKICGFDGCMAAFSHELALVTHQRRLHREKKFICDLCGKAFRIFREMKQHMFIHIECKPFKCNQCDKSYTLERVLKAHELAVHSGIEHPFKCDHCEKAYKYKEDLRGHRNAYHFGKFPAVCKVCGKGYTSASSKNYHEKRCTANPGTMFPR